MMHRSKATARSKNQFILPCEALTAAQQLSTQPQSDLADYLLSLTGTEPGPDGLDIDEDEYERWKAIKPVSVGHEAAKDPIGLRRLQ